MEKAVILLSGGLDSATCLAIARDQGYICHALSIDYGQTNRAELKAARRVARHLSVHKHHEMVCDMGLFKGSALTDTAIPVPKAKQGSDSADSNVHSIPSTYVPARNTIFLSLALGLAEVIGSTNLFIGVNTVDYSGYPDCRPEYIKAFCHLANLATKAGLEGHAMTIHTPLIEMSKSDIIQVGTKLGVDYSLTISCYNPSSEGIACGVCDSCSLRKQGFVEAGVDDPVYTNS